jgi:hypothetical protein
MKHDTEAYDLDSVEAEDCFCDTLPVDHFNSVCSVCRVAQLSDFDYVSNWLSSTGEE